MLEVKGLSKSYTTEAGERVLAVDRISLSVSAGEMFTLVGPSGCGKTTTLRCIAGLEVPDEGRIVVDGQVVFDSSEGIVVPPHRRKFGMVFQSYAIWPHMTVFENVAFPLRVSKDPIPGGDSRTGIRELVHESLALVGMADLADRSATQLSGGQQQRLALARALVGGPRLLLLDEPLSNLDAKLRERMRFELKNLQSKLGVTAIYVTHDQGEALALSDHIAVMHGGSIIQRGSPTDIYYAPSTPFVADFIGSANLIAGTTAAAARVGEEVMIDIGDGQVLTAVSRGDVPIGSKVVVGVRPEALRIAVEGSPLGGNQLRGVVRGRVFLGEVTDYLVECGQQALRVRLIGVEGQFEIGDAVFIGGPVDRFRALPDEGTELLSPESSLDELVND